MPTQLVVVYLHGIGEEAKRLYALSSIGVRVGGSAEAGLSQVLPAFSRADAQIISPPRPLGAFDQDLPSSLTPPKHTPILHTLTSVQ